LEPARRRLDAILRDVRSLDGFILVLEGHADEAGDPESNLALSLARAHKVRAYLVERGLPADRVIVMGFGSTRPRSDGRTEQGRQRNRRVELWLRPAGDLP
jgi:outer membrane protein OmpA-like peptidoglycan-associated protein